jgi:hypothetical protein
MKKIVLATVVAGLVGANAAYFVLDKRSQSRLMEIQSENTSIKDQLFGYTKYTDYIAAGKQVVTEQAKFLAAKVVREYDMVEHLQVGRLGVKSNATVVVHYTVEYAFGFDLKPADFELKATPAGLEVKLGKPILVASPAVTPTGHEILEKGFLTDEKEAVILLQQRLPAIAQSKGLAMAQEESIRALCEKKLADFLRDFMGKQPGVQRVPTIAVVYR